MLDRHIHLSSTHGHRVIDEILREQSCRDRRFLPSSRDSCQRLADERLRFLLNAPQVLAPAKAFRVKLVDLFCAGRTRREPTLRGDNFQAADSRAVARRGREHRLNRVTGKLGRFDIFRREL